MSIKGTIFNKLSRGVGTVFWKGAELAAHGAVSGTEMGARAAYVGLDAVHQAGAFVGDNKLTRPAIEKITDSVMGFLSPEKLLKEGGEYEMPHFSKRAVGLIGTAGVAASAMGASDEYEKNRIGTIDPSIKSPTPDFSAYTKMRANSNYSPAPAGADGSLVFALNNTKNGGFL